MKAATAEKVDDAAKVVAIINPNPDRPAFAATGRNSLVVLAGVAIVVGTTRHLFDVDTEVLMPSTLVPGIDLGIQITTDGVLIADVNTYGANPWDGVIQWLGGFHYAPGGNATGREGGDGEPAINPCSIWDLNFRPACPDPRGMALVDIDAYGHPLAAPFWADIYLLGCDWPEDGSSRCGAFIADGNDTPRRDDTDVYEELDYATAVEIFGKLGKALLSVEDYFAAAFGVTEGTSLGKDPKTTGLDAPRTSRFGLMQASGVMSTWAHDGDPDPTKRRACRVGGNWGYGDWAGARCAGVEYWPDYSYGWVGARGRSDHLTPATAAR